jgi:hypothetical protein
MKKVLKSQKFKAYKQKNWVIKIMKTDLKNWCLATPLYSTVWNPESFSPMKLGKELLRIITKRKMERVPVFFKKQHPTKLIIQIS